MLLGVHVELAVARAIAEIVGVVGSRPELALFLGSFRGRHDRSLARIDTGRDVRPVPHGCGSQRYQEDMSTSHLTTLARERAAILLADPGDDLLTLAEVAAALRTTIPGVRSRIARGTLRATRPGRRVLVRRADLAAYVAASALPCLDRAPRGA